MKAVDNAPKPGVGGVKYLEATVSLVLSPGMTSIEDRGTTSVVVVAVGKFSLGVVLVKQQNLLLSLPFADSLLLHNSAGPDILLHQVAFRLRK